MYKVLTRACKHFGVDPYLYVHTMYWYRTCADKPCRTKLLHIVTLDGSTSIQPFACSRDDTLRQLGAQSGDTFLLQVSEGSEDEEDDED